MSQRAVILLVCTSLALPACLERSGYEPGMPADRDPGDSRPGDLGPTDPAAPWGSSLRIDAGAPFTTVADVTLQLVSENTTEMYVTNDAGCASGGSWEAFQASRAWVLGQANGLATVYAIFRSSAGRTGACLQAAIIHDDVPPTAVSAVLDGDVTNSLTDAPRIAWTGGGLDVASGRNRFEYALGTTAGATDVLPWASAGAATSVVVSGLSMTDGASYFATVRVLDNAGNVSPPANGDGFVVDVTPPALTVDTPAAAVVLHTVSLTVAGLCEAGLVVGVTYSAGLAGPTVTACVLGAYTLTVVIEPGQGSYTVTVSQSDAASNAAVIARTFRYGGITPVLSRVDRLAGPNATWGGADGVGAAARFRCPDKMDSDGSSLYVADACNNTVREVVLATGEVKTLAGLAGSSACLEGNGSSARLARPGGVALVGSTLYVSAMDCHQLFALDLGTRDLTVVAGDGFATWADGQGTAASFDTPEGLMSDGTYLYITESGGNRIRRMTLATADVITLAGSTAGTAGYTNGGAAAARFQGPAGVVEVGTDLYVADFRNSAIRLIAGGNVSTFAGAPPPGDTSSDPADGLGTAARFDVVNAIASDGTYLYVADLEGQALRQVELATAMVTTVTGRHEVWGRRDGPLATALFDGVAGIGVVGNTLYISDLYNALIRKVDRAADRVTTLAGNSSPTAASPGYADGAAEDARFYYVSDVLFRSPEELLVGDGNNAAIRQVSAIDGQTTTLTGGNGVGSLDGSPATAQFGGALALAMSGTTLYVGDRDACTLRKVDLATHATTTVLGIPGVCDYVNGTGTAVRLGGIESMVVVGTKLYVVAGAECAIRVLDLETSTVSTYAGAPPPGNCGTVNATGTAARFEAVYSIASDGTNLYVGETFEHRIRRINLTTPDVTMFAGSSTCGFVDGVGTSAQFNQPTDLGTDGTTLFVADRYNNAIRTIELGTGVVDTLVGNGPVTLAEIDGPLASASFLEPDSLAVGGVGLVVFVSAGQNLRVIH